MCDTLEPQCPTSFRREKHQGKAYSPGFSNNFLTYFFIEVQLIYNINWFQV